MTIKKMSYLLMILIYSNFMAELYFCLKLKMASSASKMYFLRFFGAPLEKYLSVGW